MNVNKDFADALRAKLAEAGYSKDETMLGGLASEYRAALDMLSAVRDTEALHVARTMLAITGARLVALCGESMKIEAPRVVDASKLISREVEAMYGKQSTTPANDAGTEESKPTVH
jgi:hypothetical protein